MKIFLKKNWRPPTCPKFNTHKKVVHFFIPMWSGGGVDYLSDPRYRPPTPILASEVKSESESEKSESEKVKVK